MSKYTFVLYHKRQKEFLTGLQELGLVDITTTGWEANDEERAMIISLEQHRAAAAYFKALAKDENFKPGEPFKNGSEAFDAYLKASNEIENLKATLEKARKEAEELSVWGDFSPADLRKLADNGIQLRFFSVYTNEFSNIAEKWGEELMIESISDVNGITYFVVVQTEQQEIPFDAQEYRFPDMTAQQKEAYVGELQKELAVQEAVIARAAASADMIAEHGAKVEEKLDFSRAANSGEREAEETLIIMEGWATKETSEQVDQLLESWPDVVYIKERPTPEDDTPVVLKNSKATSPFEIIGDFYSLPKYGTLDLTSFFGPFYMIFFGFCLGDAGYGLLLFLAGFFLRKKGGKMKQVANLTFLCGGAAAVFGFLIGSFFGIDLGGLEMFANVREKFITTDSLFYVALWMGVVQIFFGLILKVINITIQSGFKYSLGTIGWMMVLPYIVLVLFGMLQPEAGYSVDFSSPVTMAVMGVGLVLMLFFHNPDKNPLKNVGGGLWNTYNDVTGFLGDFLSYIRLFALCLSGGTLAIVFNDLALGLAPQIPVLRQLVVILILAFGHGINLFMAALGSFVHPMRLTFVEFYKNAGFETTQRRFTPLKKNTNS